MLGDDSVDKTVLKSLLCGHEVVSVGVLFDLLDGLARILGQYLVEHISCAKNELGADLDIACLTLCTAERLVDHYFAMRKSNSLALCSCGKEECAHACRHTDTNG